MTANQLRDEIGRALRALWPRFSAQHPGLEARLDPDAALDAAADHFADDPDYQHALADAAARQAPHQEMSRLIQALTRDWLRNLLG
jgi:hypothetical protein